MNEPAVNVGSRVQVIRGATWTEEAPRLKHVFLVGDLQLPTPHPFLRRRDVEVIACVYSAGDNGEPHWHAEVDEIEFILDGAIAYREIATGKLHSFMAGDLLNIPRGSCVERIVAVPARTLAIKLPSRREKILCRQCDRSCSYRRQDFQAV